MSKLYIISFLFSIQMFSQTFTIGYSVVGRPYTDRSKEFREAFYLDTDLSHSLFRSETQKKSDSLFLQNGFGLGLPNNFDEQIYVVKNTSVQTAYRLFISPVSRDKFYVIIEPPKWTIIDEKKFIDGYECRKATTYYGGRKWEAWFCPDVKIFDGPYVFAGLPGLILTVTDEHNDYEFTFNSIKKSNDQKLGYPNITRSISWDDLKKIKKNYYDDPFVFAKQKNLKTATDDGNGGTKRVNYKEMTSIVRNRILLIDNPIELDSKIDYVPNK